MAVVAGFQSSFLVTSQPGVAFTNEATTTSDRITYTLSNAAKRYLDKSVAPVIQTSPDGTTWTTVTTGFTLFRCNARVVFVVAQPVGTQVRFVSGNYLPYTTLGEAATCEFVGKMEMLPADVFQGASGTGSKVFVPGTLTGTMKTNTWWLNQTRVNSVFARDLLVVSFVTASLNRYEGYCYAQDCNIKANSKSLVGQDLTFQLTDEFFNA